MLVCSPLIRAQHIIMGSQLAIRYIQIHFICNLQFCLNSFIKLISISKRIFFGGGHCMASIDIGRRLACSTSSIPLDKYLWSSLMKISSSATEKIKKKIFVYMEKPLTIYTILKAGRSLEMGAWLAWFVSYWLHYVHFLAGTTGTRQMEQRQVPSPHAVDDDNNNVRCRKVSNPRRGNCRWRK